MLWATWLKGHSILIAAAPQSLRIVLGVQQIWYISLLWCFNKLDDKQQAQNLKVSFFFLFLSLPLINGCNHLSV